MVIKAIQSNQFHQAEAVLELKLELIVHMEELLVEQVGLLQADEIGARQGQLQTHVLLDTRDAVASVHRVFALYAKYQKDRSL
jgi:hypothetical protein